MRQKRAKVYRKLMHQYELQFGFRDPYQLLVDDTFALALARYKITDTVHQFSNVLQSKKVKPLITQCCMVALYKLGKEHQDAVDIAKQWERRMCNHREAIDPEECVKQCVGSHNKHRYIVASERGELRRDLRLKVVGLPMMHFAQAVMVMEPMSPLTKTQIEANEARKLSLPASEASLLRSAPSVEVDIVGGEPAESGDAQEPAPPVRKPRGAKAPNPLSVRKSKTPKLTKEEKMRKEQELKKLKQKAAAKARLAANATEPVLKRKRDKVPAPDSGPTQKADGETSKRKRGSRGAAKKLSADTS